MDDIAELASQLESNRRAAAEGMSFGERLLAGAALFDLSMTMMRAGIRMQHPEADESQIDQIVLERLRNARRLEMLE